MAIALAAAVSLASGYLLVGARWPRSRTSLSAWAMKLSLAAGFGLGISSVAFFLVRMDDTPHFVLLDLLVLATLSIIYARLRFQFAGTARPDQTIADLVVAPWLGRVLISCFVFTIAAGLYTAVVSVLVHPHGGGWDAFSIWNLHARFLFRGGSHWRDGFNALIPWAHPDYPLLLPATTARIWSYLGNDSPAVPAVVGLVFTVGTITLLVSSLSYLRGRNAAILAGIALSATPFFIAQGAAQYADVALSFFILAAMVLLQFGLQGCAGNNRTEHGNWALAGLSAGLAAWTKNEGLLFLIAMFAAYLWVFRPTEELRGESIERSERLWGLFGATLLGAAPMLAVIAWFKHSIATAGDLFSSPALMLSKVLTPSRYWAILRWYGKEFFHFGDWWLAPGTVLLVVFYFLLREKGPSPKNPSLRASVATLGLMLTGYFAIYLITPRDLYWHLRFSLNRLFLQVWPASLFLFFLFVAPQTPAQNALNSSKKWEEL